MSKRKEHKNVKLSDIAAELNISTVSVSNALNGKKGVSDELRQKVFDTAEELGYRHGGADEAQQKSVQYNIGVIIAERYIRQQGVSFYMSIYQEIVLAALNKGCMTLLEVLSSENEEQYKIPDTIAGARADGIIILGELMHPYTRILKDSTKMPIVFLDHYEDTPDTDFIISDSYNGMHSMTRLLIEEGYRRIGFVGEILKNSSITDRYLGYRKALMEEGLELRDDWITRLEKDADNQPYIPLPEDMPDAFVCHCDVTAKLLIDQLRGLGYSIPGDIGIVGFDNYLVDDIDGVSLTTYDVDVRAMAQIAVNTVIRKLERTHFISRLRIVDGGIILGNSHKR